MKTGKSKLEIQSPNHSISQSLNLSITQWPDSPFPRFPPFPVCPLTLSPFPFFPFSPFTRAPPFPLFPHFPFPVLRQMQIDAGFCSLLSKDTATSLGGNVRATNKPSEWLGVVANAFLCTCDISMGSTRSVPLIEGDLGGEE